MDALRYGTCELTWLPGCFCNNSKAMQASHRFEAVRVEALYHEQRLQYNFERVNTTCILSNVSFTLHMTLSNITFSNMTLFNILQYDTLQY